MGYRTKIRHLSEDNARAAIDGDPIISTTSGHISVKGSRGIVSRTKNLESRIASIKTVIETLNHVLDKINSDDPSEYQPAEYEKNIIDNYNMKYKEFKTNIDEKYDYLTKMDDLIEGYRAFIVDEKRKTTKLRYDVDQSSVDIRDLEELFIREICKKLGRIQYYMHCYDISKIYIDTMMPVVKGRIETIKKTLEEKIYLPLEDTSSDKEPTMNIIEAISDIDMRLFFNPVLARKPDSLELQHYKIYETPVQNKGGKSYRMEDKKYKVYPSEWDLDGNLETKGRLVNIYEKIHEVYKYGDASITYKICNRWDKGAIEVVEDNYNGDSQFVTIETSKAVLTAGGYAKPGQFVQEDTTGKEQKRYMSYDEIIDEYINVISNKYDMISNYTPYKSLKERK